MPFIIGLAGSVSAGKSTTARVLQALLARWPTHPLVALVPTDGFLFANGVLEARGLMNRKGFPESYDLTRLLNFLGDVKSGKDRVEAPVYSHLIYDVLPDQALVIERPDIVIVEGLNVLQPAKLPKDGEAIPFVSDFFDFSIYIDAAEELVESWYVERFLRQRTFRPCLLFPSLRDTLGRRGDGNWPVDLAYDQPRQSAQEHLADSAARGSDPAQGRGSCGRDSRAQKVVIAAAGCYFIGSL
jgi:uridine kinase